MGWNYLSIPKLQRCNRWSLGMDKIFYPTLYWACNYLSMLGLKLNHVSKRGHRGVLVCANYPEATFQIMYRIPLGTYLEWSAPYLHNNALSVDCCTKEHKPAAIVTTQIASLQFFLHSLAAALEDLQNWVAIRQISFKLWITSPHEVCTLGGIPLQNKPLTHFQPQLCMQNNLCPGTSKCLLGIIKEGNKVLLLCMNYAGKWHLISPVKPTTHLFVQRLTQGHNEYNIYSPFEKGIHWWLMGIPSQRTSY